jgi:hypothetical protein
MPRPSTLAATLVLVGACGCGPADKPATTAPESAPAATDGAKPLSEKEKIEALIRHVEGLQDAVFVRNGSDYDAKTAGKFLRGKWDKESAVKTARDFIDKVASVSSTSGKAYLIRFKDGKEVKSGEYLSRELEKLEKGGS